MAKTDKLRSDFDGHRHGTLADCSTGLDTNGHTIGFSWNGEKLLVYVDGNLVRSW